MNNGRILVVEDEKDIRDGLCELLCREGYMVAACEYITTLVPPRKTFMMKWFNIFMVLHGHLVTLVFIHIFFQLF